ncbi:MAG: hypothetical protein H7210_12850 [Pyrinomonadaceae bacterium]|nr:hypothetical protein [Phycisphaerales bacterium]
MSIGPAPSTLPDITTQSSQHLAWLLELTQIPTASGREHRVIRWIENWLKERPDLHLSKDARGNLVVSQRGNGAAAAVESGTDAPPPLFITAHLDHPAFVVERVVSPTILELSFRGGVLDVFFENAPITVHPGLGRAEPLRARLTGLAAAASPMGKHYLAELEIAGDQSDGPSTIRVGDVATWELPPAEIDSRGIVHTHGCDDLAAAAAALSAYDVLRQSRCPDVHLLFTRAEEIGFIGAIAACKLGTIPQGARVVALENSRSFPDSPIGGGPIVRVGDRMSIFTPWLTNACAKRAEQIANAPAQPTATQTTASMAGAKKWQRKLMAGGACEASVFCAYGYDATCLCLPLGNYHNMPYLTELQAGGGAYDTQVLGPPRAAREFIAVSDYLGLIELLVAIGLELPSVDPVLERVEKLYVDKGSVLDE